MGRGARARERPRRHEHLAHSFDLPVPLGEVDDEAIPSGREPLEDPRALEAEAIDHHNAAALTQRDDGAATGPARRT